MVADRRILANTYETLRNKQGTTATLNDLLRAIGSKGKPETTNALSGFHACAVQVCDVQVGIGMVLEGTIIGRGDSYEEACGDLLDRLLSPEINLTSCSYSKLEDVCLVVTAR